MHGTHYIDVVRVCGCCDYQEIDTYNQIWIVIPILSWCYTGCPKKSGILVWNFNFKRNIAVKLLHLCLFQSLLIQLFYGG